MACTMNEWKLVQKFSTENGSWTKNFAGHWNVKTLRPFINNIMNTSIYFFPLSTDGWILCGDSFMYQNRNGPTQNELGLATLSVIIRLSREIILSCWNVHANLFFRAKFDVRYYFHTSHNASNFWQAGKFNTNMVLCTICLENNEKNFVALKCGHIFHFDCVVRWNCVKKCCPNCRNDLHVTTILYCKFANMIWPYFLVQCYIIFLFPIDH